MGKLAGRRVTFHAPARTGAIAAALAAAALLLPNTALAATEIGSAAGSETCGSAAAFMPFDSVQISSSGNSYAVPVGGTSITSWTVWAGDDTGPAGLEIWRPTAPTYTLIASVPVQTLTANSLNTFSTSIPVHAGDLLGLRVEGPLNCTVFTSNASDVIGFSFGTAAAVGDAVSMSQGLDLQLDFAAGVDVTINPPPPPPTPTSADQCKHGGWQGLTDSKGTLFKNQGDCVSFVATQGTNLAG